MTFPLSVAICGMISLILMDIDQSLHVRVKQTLRFEYIHVKMYCCFQAFWRSCSFILGSVLETAFKDDFYIQLCSFPKPDGKNIYLNTK